MCFCSPAPCAIRKIRKRIEVGRRKLWAERNGNKITSFSGYMALPRSLLPSSFLSSPLCFSIPFRFDILGLVKLVFNIQSGILIKSNLLIPKNISARMIKFNLLPLMVQVCVRRDGMWKRRVSRVKFSIPKAFLRFDDSTTTTSKRGNLMGVSG